jgi:diguanylate cyclase (GGDEF)-like protein
MLCGLPRLSAQRYNFQSYSEESGLTNLSVQCLLQDHTGFIWVGTENGLFRYDGHQFVAFHRDRSLPDLMINTLHETADGVLWIGSSAGLFRLQGDLILPALPAMPWEVHYRDTLASGQHGRLFAATTHGLLIGDPPQAPGGPRGFHFYANPQLAPGTAVYSVYVDAEDALWFSYGMQLYRLKNSQLQAFGIPEGVPSQSWKSIREDRTGTLWLNCPRGAWARARGAPRFVAVEPIDASSRGYLDLNERGDILVPTDRGIARWDGEHWQFMTRANGLPGDRVSCAFSDAEGSLWIGMGGTGLVRSRSYTEWESWTTAEGLGSDHIWAIQRDGRGKLWIGTNAGLDALPGKAKSAAGSAREKRPDSAAVTSFALGPNGTMWAGTSSGHVLEIDTATGSVSSYGAESGLAGTSLLIVLSLFLDTSGHLWAGTTEGLFRANARENPLRFELISTSSGSGREMFHQIVEDDRGAIWAAGRGGLARWYAGKWTRFSTQDGLRGKHITTVATGQPGELWISYGEETGVSRLRFQSTGKLSIENFSVENALHSERIAFIGKDRRGWIWIGGEHGVDVFNGAGWQYYDRARGLVWNDCNSNGFFEDADGGVWLGTSRGLGHFRPRATPWPQPPPPVVITAARWGEHALPASSEVPIFSYEAQPLVISFAALTYIEEAAVQFRYRLAGQDPNWVETKAHEVRYPNLPSGDYVFEVHARSADGVWSATTAHTMLQIRPPWWQTWWFSLLIFVPIVAAARQIWHWRTGQLVKRQKELEAAVRDRTLQLQELASSDVLTGLRNRRAIFEFLSNELAREERNGGTLTVIMTDLDNFKRINDRYGHAGGDAVLKEAALRLKSGMRVSDAVGRYGGEEFLIVLPNCSGDTARTRAEELRELVQSQPVYSDLQEIPISSSFGVASTRSGAYEMSQLLKEADDALYRAKQAGRNCVVVAETSDLRVDVA